MTLGGECPGIRYLCKVLDGQVFWNQAYMFWYKFVRYLCKVSDGQVSDILCKVLDGEVFWYQACLGTNLSPLIPEHRNKLGVNGGAVGANDSSNS